MGKISVCSNDDMYESLPTIRWSPFQTRTPPLPSNAAPTTTLYSPAATSDSSGFSERETTTTSSAAAAGPVAASASATAASPFAGLIGSLHVDRALLPNSGLYSLPGHASMGSREEEEAIQ